MLNHGGVLDIIQHFDKKNYSLLLSYILLIDYIR